MSLQKPSRNYIHQPILSHTYTLSKHTHINRVTYWPMQSYY